MTSPRPLLLAKLLALLVMVPTWAQIPSGRFVDVQPVLGLDSDRADHSPWASDDGLRLYFTAGWGNNGDLWYAERQSTKEAFGEPVRLPDSINHDGEEECCFFLFDDERSMLFESDRPELTDSTDTLIATRDSIALPWHDPTPFPSEFAKDLDAIWDLEFAPDKRLLYFSGAVELGVDVGLYVAQRSDVNAPFGPAIPLSVNSNDYEQRNQTVSSDGRLLVYQSDEDADHELELWAAFRNSLNEPFGDPVKIDELFPDSEIDVDGLGEATPYITRDWPRDGAKLYFAFGTVADADIYEATWEALDGLQAGDADQDLDFDQLDLVRVLSAAKYLTTEPATWGDGDWNGAPGGSPGEPPDGDGQFNQLDIMAALANGTYLTGPYMAVHSDAISILSPRSRVIPMDIESFTEVSMNLTDAGTMGDRFALSGADLAYVPEPSALLLVVTGVLVVTLSLRRHEHGSQTSKY